LAIVCFFVLMTAQGLIGANGGALASAEVPDHPGTGSAVLGFVQSVAAGAIAPIAGLGGEYTAVQMALLMVAGAAVSMVGLLVVARPNRPNTATRCRYLWWFESFAVVGGSGLFLAQTPVFGPVPDVVGGVPGGQDELGE